MAVVAKLEVDGDNNRIQQLESGDFGLCADVWGVVNSAKRSYDRYVGDKLVSAGWFMVNIRQPGGSRASFWCDEVITTYQIKEPEYVDERGK